jgi:DNA-binding transcriptional LysR family regulator
MDIRHLRTFVTVARLGSVTRAAEALHLTQPAVSGQLKTLEDELDVKLLARTTTSVSLTRSGEALLPRAERAIAAFGEFVHAAKSLRGHIGGRLRLGVPMLEADLLRIGPFMQRMVQRHPALEIDLQVGRTPWLLDALRDAELDASIFVCRTLPKDMSGIVLTPLVYCLVAPVAWKERLAGAGWAAAAQWPWIRMTPRSAHDEMLKELLDGAGIRPQQTVLADHESLICALVAAGVGVGLVRDELARRGERDGTLFTLGDATVRTTLSFIYPRERKADPALAAGVDVLRGVWELAGEVSSPGDG